MRIILIVDLCPTCPVRSQVFVRGSSRGGQAVSKAPVCIWSFEGWGLAAGGLAIEDQAVSPAGRALNNE